MACSIFLLYPNHSPSVNYSPNNILLPTNLTTYSIKHFIIKTATYCHCLIFRFKYWKAALCITYQIPVSKTVFSF